ncbi:unnamed protein product [Pylaiella littoralis]
MPHRLALRLGFSNTKHRNGRRASLQINRAVRTPVGHAFDTGFSSPAKGALPRLAITGFRLRRCRQTGE